MGLQMDSLSQEQVSEFKEAFNMFEDACECGRKISFSEFVSMMGEKMHSDDEAKTIANAFESFDANVTGYITHDEFRKILSMGKSKFSDKEIRDFIKMGDAGEGKIDYVTLSREIGGA